jgi:hypothetical protein
MVSYKQGGFCHAVAIAPKPARQDRVAARNPAITGKIVEPKLPAEAVSPIAVALRFGKTSVSTVNRVVVKRPVPIPNKTVATKNVRVSIATERARIIPNPSPVLNTSTFRSPIRSPRNPPGNCASAYANQSDVKSNPAVVKSNSKTDRIDGRRAGKTTRTPMAKNHPQATDSRIQPRPFPLRSAIDVRSRLIDDKSAYSVNLWN